MGLITGMDYPNGHLYVSYMCLSLRTFVFSFENQGGLERAQNVISPTIVWF